MERKTYRKNTLSIFIAILIFSGVHGQSASAPPKKTDTLGKDYQQKMKDLQQNMRNLEKEMIELRQQHLKEAIKNNTGNSNIRQYVRVDTSRNFITTDSIRTYSRKAAGNVTARVQSFFDSRRSVNGFSFKEEGLEKRKQNLIEKTKTYSKSYAVNKNDKLTIDNQYGKITVNTWNKNEIKVDVDIRVGTTDEAESQKLLDNISIISAKDQNGVTFKTSFENQEHRSAFTISNDGNYRGNRSTSVNYTVFMPVKNALNVTNRFGSIVLPDMEGPVTVNNTYGNLTAKELSNTENDIRIRFGSATIDALNGGSLNFQYGRLKIGTATNLKATVGYSPVDIDRLKSSAQVKVNYGSGLKINNLDKNLKNLDIDANFTNVSLDLKGSEDFLFDVTVKYNKFNYNDNAVKVITPVESDGAKRVNFIKNYKGYVGRSGSDNKVTIKSNYNGVSFN